MSIDSSAAHDAALAFLLNRIDYERGAEIPYHSRGLNLDRIRDLLRRLDNPQDHLRIIHVAGTKGKGSTAAMIASILTAPGYRTGLFSSPHLDRVEERLAIDGEPCSSAELVDLVESIRPVIEQMDREAATLVPAESGPTYFEITTAIGLLHYRRRQVHTAVLEVGMGGRLDSTNVVEPVLSLITSISFDHTQQLGNNLASIATEKAGIIKPGVPVISGVTADEPRQVIVEVCRQRGSPLLELGHDFSVTYSPPRRLETTDSTVHIDFTHADGSPGIQNLSLPLIGRHQAANAALALASIEQLRRRGWQIPEAAVRTGLINLHWHARVEVVARRPAVVLDVAHNVASVEALLETLSESFHARRRYLIFATTKDKDIRGMLQWLLPAFDHVWLTQYSSNPRAASVDAVAALAADCQTGSWETCPHVAAAWEQVQRRVQSDDLVCITGSFFLAAEFRDLIRRTSAAVNGLASAPIPDSQTPVSI